MALLFLDTVQMCLGTVSDSLPQEVYNLDRQDRRGRTGKGKGLAEGHALGKSQSQE